MNSISRHLLLASCFFLKSHSLHNILNQDDIQGLSDAAKLFLVNQEDEIGLLQMPVSASEFLIANLGFKIFTLMGIAHSNNWDLLTNCFLISKEDFDPSQMSFNSALSTILLGLPLLASGNYSVYSDEVFEDLCSLIQDFSNFNAMEYRLETLIEQLKRVIDSYTNKESRYQELEQKLPGMFARKQTQDIVNLVSGFERFEYTENGFLLKGKPVSSSSDILTMIDTIRKSSEANLASLKACLINCEDILAVINKESDLESLIEAFTSGRLILSNRSSENSAVEAINYRSKLTKWTKQFSVSRNNAQAFKTEINSHYISILTGLEGVVSSIIDSDIRNKHEEKYYLLISQFVQCLSDATINSISSKNDRQTIDVTSITNSAHNAINISHKLLNGYKNGNVPNDQFDIFHEMLSNITQTIFAFIRSFSQWVDFSSTHEDCKAILSSITNRVNISLSLPPQNLPEQPQDISHINDLETLIKHIIKNRMDKTEDYSRRAFSIILKDFNSIINYPPENIDSEYIEQLLQNTANEFYRAILMFSPFNGSSFYYQMFTQIISVLYHLNRLGDYDYAPDNIVNTYSNTLIPELKLFIAQANSFKRGLLHDKSLVFLRSQILIDLLSIEPNVDESIFDHLKTLLDQFMPNQDLNNLIEFSQEVSMLTDQYRTIPHGAAIIRQTIQSIIAKYRDKISIDDQYFKSNELYDILLAHSFLDADKSDPQFINLLINAIIQAFFNNVLEDESKRPALMNAYSDLYTISDLIKTPGALNRIQDQMTLIKFAITQFKEMIGKANYQPQNSFESLMKIISLMPKKEGFQYDFANAAARDQHFKTLYTKHKQPKMTNKEVLLSIFREYCQDIHPNSGYDIARLIINLPEIDLTINSQFRELL
jgi:hypothetical protein